MPLSASACHFQSLFHGVPLQLLRAIFQFVVCGKSEQPSFWAIVWHIRHFWCTWVLHFKGSRFNYMESTVRLPIWTGMVKMQMTQIFSSFRFVSKVAAEYSGFIVNEQKFVRIHRTDWGRVQTAQIPRQRGNATLMPCNVHWKCVFKNTLKRSIFLFCRSRRQASCRNVY